MIQGELRWKLIVAADNDDEGSHKDVDKLSDALLLREDNLDYQNEVRKFDIVVVVMITTQYVIAVVVGFHSHHVCSKSPR